MSWGESKESIHGACDRRIAKLEALLRRWMGGLVPVGDYSLRDETLAVLGEQEATPPEPDVCPRCGCTKREMYREGCRRQDGPPHPWHRESTVEAERGDVERWPGTTERPWFVEGLTAMDRFRSRVILYVGDSDQDRADLAMTVEAVNAYAASAPQGEAEPPDEGLRQAVMEEWGWDWRTAPACRRVLGEDDFARRRARAPQGEGNTDE